MIGINAHRKLKGAQIENEHYAVLNEQTNRFRELMYYITPEEQKKQLAEHGFALERAVNVRGETADLTSESGPWIYYVCSKA